MSTHPSPAFVLDDTSWEFYQQLLHELERSGRRLRVSYDDGQLEMMRRTTVHEQSKVLIGRFIEAYALEADLALTGLGSPNLLAERQRSGCNPDECYFVTTPAPPMLAAVDLSAYSPPDLAIEICVTPGSIDRLPILDAIGIREVWRFDGRSVKVLVRQDGGTYRDAARSLSLPELPLDVVDRFARLGMETSQGHAVLAFHQWLREKH